MHNQSLMKKPPSQSGGTGDKRWGSGGEGVDVDYPLVNVDDDKYLWFVEGHLG
jgi:hypothetical protein